MNTMQGKRFELLKALSHKACEGRGKTSRPFSRVFDTGNKPGTKSLLNLTRLNHAPSNYFIFLFVSRRVFGRCEIIPGPKTGN